MKTKIKLRYLLLSAILITSASLPLAFSACGMEVTSIQGISGMSTLYPLEVHEWDKSYFQVFPGSKELENKGYKWGTVKYDIVAENSYKSEYVFTPKDYYHITIAQFNDDSPYGIYVKTMNPNSLYRYEVFYSELLDTQVQYHCKFKKAVYKRYPLKIKEKADTYVITYYVGPIKDHWFSNDADKLVPKTIEVPKTGIIITYK